MQEKNIVRTFRTAKIVQLCILIAIEVAFFAILLCNSTFAKTIYQNSTLLILCGFIWIYTIFSLAYLLFDFIKLRSFAEESHVLNKEAYLDTLTGMPNRHGLDVALRSYDTPESLAKAGCFIATIDNLKTTNEIHGRSVGDMLIQNFSSIFENLGDQLGIVGRNGGNEFILIINDCSAETMQNFCETLNERIEGFNSEHVLTPLQLKHTFILNSELHAESFTHLLMETYKKLHQ